MLHYKIAFRNDKGVSGIIVPCAAAKRKPRELKNITPDPSNVLFRIVRDNLNEIPGDLFHRYLDANRANIFQKDGLYSFWQEGMVLEEDGSTALVELVHNRRIEITVWGEAKEAFRNKLEMRFDSLLKEYPFTIEKQERTIAGRVMTEIVIFITRWFMGD